MPGADIYIPEGALSADAERTLVRRLTNFLIEAEGLDPRNEVTQSVAKIAVHRPTLYVGGSASPVPHYYFFAMLPEGQFDPQRWKIAVARITDAFMDAETGARPREPGRVWVFMREIPDGTWGALGQVRTLADMLTFQLKDAEAGRRIAAERLSTRHKKGTAS